MPKSYLNDQVEVGSYVVVTENTINSTGPYISIDGREFQLFSEGGLQLFILK
ncbi:hypothetical protein D3C75_1132150 [compost metagenome]